MRQSNLNSNYKLKAEERQSDLFGVHAEVEKIFHISIARIAIALCFLPTLHSNWYWSDAVMFLKETAQLSRWLHEACVRVYERAVDRLYVI